LADIDIIDQIMFLNK